MLIGKKLLNAVVLPEMRFIRGKRLMRTDVLLGRSEMEVCVHGWW